MKRFPFFATLVFCLWACQKDQKDCPPDLPCATQTGENTFGCYINGVPWVAKIEPFVFDPTAHTIEASYDETDYGTFNDNYMRLLGVYSGDTSSSLIMHLKPLLQTGGITIDSLNFYGISFRTPHAVYEIDKDSPYEVNITKLDFGKKNYIGYVLFQSNLWFGFY